MTIPALHLAASTPADIDADVVAFGVVKGPDGPRLAAPEGAHPGLEAAITALGLTGQADEVTRVPATSTVPGAASIALVGLGAAPDRNALRRGAGALTRVVRGVDTIAIAIPAADDAEAEALLEGAALGAYAFDGFRSKPDAQKSPAARVVLLASASPDVVADASARAEAVHLVRDLVNTPPSHLYPQTFAEQATELVAAAAAAGAPIEATVLAEPELTAGGYGGIIAVGKGSTRGPRLVEVSYRPAGAARHLAIVGKGITFDSGGLSLKPASSMVGMKYDMTGAASALAVVLGAARLGVPTRITAWLCLAENLPGGDATRPNDVVAMRNGLTVEITNTDAEGRMVLGDGLARASEDRPDAIVDIATLTGAARNAFGGRIVASMGDEELTARINAVAAGVGESFWPVPLAEEFMPMMKSDVADLQNAKIGMSGGGMIYAGLFLREFVGRTGEDDDAPRIPWTHLDIAGPASNDGAAWGFTGKGPTGVTVRTLLALAEELAAG